MYIKYTQFIELFARFYCRLRSHSEGKKQRYNFFIIIVIVVVRFHFRHPPSPPSSQDINFASPAYTARVLYLEVDRVY